MTTIAGQIAAGDLSRRVVIPRLDEVGLLATSFNLMADAIQEHTTELTKLSESLTVRVEERTINLQTTNEILKQEIREREQVEEALEKSENRLRLITDSMLDIVCQTDKAGIIEYTSQSCGAVLGYNPEALLGKSIYSGVHPDDMEQVKDATQNIGRFECRHRHGNGEYLWLETLSSLLFSEQGELIGIVFASRDSTMRRRAIEDLEELNRLKTDFLSTAAHELRTPLTSIRGFSEILLTRALAVDRRQRSIGLINEQSNQLGKLIDDLLDLSRMEAKGNLVLQLGPVNITDLLNKVVGLFAESSTGHQVFFEGLDKSPPLVADSFRLQQVLNNLLSNAVKYSPKGGRITIHSHVRGDKLEISVQDEGMGMTPEQQTHLFEKFYQEDASNTAIIGTGLGLTITKLIVELHGGTIWAHSQAGVGTTFYVRLPLSEVGQTFMETVP